MQLLSIGAALALALGLGGCAGMGMDGAHHDGMMGGGMMGSGMMGQHGGANCPDATPAGHGAEAAPPSGQAGADGAGHAASARADCPPAAEQQQQHEHGATPPPT